MGIRRLVILLCICLFRGRGGEEQRPSCPWADDDPCCRQFSMRRFRMYGQKLLCFDLPNRFIR